MKTHCENEQVVVAALRSGSLHGELLVHAGACPVCSEVLLVMDFLQEEARFAKNEDESPMPDPARIWQRAQGLAREEAVAKAILPIRIAQIFACVAAIFALPWLASLKLLSGIPVLSLRHFPPVDRIWSPPLASATLLSLTVMLVCIGLSSWYLLQEE